MPFIQLALGAEPRLGYAANVVICCMLAYLRSHNRQGGVEEGAWESGGVDEPPGGGVLNAGGDAPQVGCNGFGGCPIHQRSQGGLQKCQSPYIILTKLSISIVT